MRFLIVRLGLILGTAIAMAACGSSSGTEPTPTITALAIAGPSSVGGVGQTSQLTLTATTSSGVTQTVTANAQWQSSNPAVAVISSGGLVTAQGYGATTVTATYQGATATLAFLVSIAGTWVYNAPDGSSLTWVLAQSQGIVTGTFAIAPLADGNSLSTAIVGGTVGDSTFTWTMTGVVGADSGRPECVGTTPIISGTARMSGSGTSMSATIQNASGVCNTRLAGSLPVGATIVLAKQ